MSEMIIVRKTRRGKLVYGKPCRICKKLSLVPEHRLKWGRGDYCSRACVSKAQSSSVASPEERFWDKVDKSGPIVRPALGPCWVWVGSRHAHGYGKIFVGGKTVRAHRFAWELERGSIPDGLHVLHKCDHPSCVRLSHLFLGTHAENVRDMISKNRAAPPRGEVHHHVRLTEDIVRRIRAEHDPAWKSGFGCRELGKKYGVSPTAIHAIVHWKTWKHVR